MREFGLGLVIRMLIGHPPVNAILSPDAVGREKQKARAGSAAGPKKEEEEIIRLPLRGQRGRAAAGCATRRPGPDPTPAWQPPPAPGGQGEFNCAGPN
jgi:hypothetical protein